MLRVEEEEGRRSRGDKWVVLMIPLLVEDRWQGKEEIEAIRCFA
jgi:hypothetical protein